MKYALRVGRSLQWPGAWTRETLEGSITDVAGPCQEERLVGAPGGGPDQVRVRIVGLARTGAPSGVNGANEGVDGDALAGLGGDAALRPLGPFHRHTGHP